MKRRDDEFEDDHTLAADDDVLEAIRAAQRRRAAQGQVSTEDGLRVFEDPEVVHQPHVGPAPEVLQRPSRTTPRTDERWPGPSGRGDDSWGRGRGWSPPDRSSTIHIRTTHTPPPPPPGPPVWLVPTAVAVFVMVVILLIYLIGG